MIFVILGDNPVHRGQVQASFDVVNLYPLVPVKEAVDTIVQILRSYPDLKQRTKLIIEVKMLLSLEW